MRRAVGIGNGRGDVELAGTHRRLADRSKDTGIRSRGRGNGRSASSHSCGAGERHEDLEHDLLAVKIEILGFRRGCADLVPYLRPSGKGNGPDVRPLLEVRRGLILLTDPAREPGADY